MQWNICQDIIWEESCPSVWIFLYAKFVSVLLAFQLTLTHLRSVRFVTNLRGKFEVLVVCESFDCFNFIIKNTFTCIDSDATRLYSNHEDPLRIRPMHQLRVMEAKLAIVYF